MTIKGSSCQVDDRSLVQRDDLTGARCRGVLLQATRFGLRQRGWF